MVDILCPAVLGNLFNLPTEVDRVLSNIPKFQALYDKYISLSSSIARAVTKLCHSFMSKLQSDMLCSSHRNTLSPTADPSIVLSRTLLRGSLSLSLSSASQVRHRGHAGRQDHEWQGEATFGGAGLRHPPTLQPSLAPQHRGLSSAVIVLGVRFLFRSNADWWF